MGLEQVTIRKLSCTLVNENLSRLLDNVLIYSEKRHTSTNRLAKIQKGQNNTKNKSFEAKIIIKKF